MPAVSVFQKWENKMGISRFVNINKTEWEPSHLDTGIFLFKPRDLSTALIVS